MAAANDDTLTASSKTDAVGHAPNLSNLVAGLSNRRKSGIFGVLPKIVEPILIVLLGLAAARLFWLLLAPLPVADIPPPVVKKSAPAQTLVAKSPFGKMATAAVPEANDQGPEDVQETSLNLKLHGVNNFGNDQSTAIIETPERKQKVFGIGDTITNGVTLRAVYANQVTITSNGVVESLKLPKKEFNSAAPARRALPRTASSRNPPPEASQIARRQLRNSRRAPGANITDFVRFKLAKARSGENAVALYAAGDPSLMQEQGLQDGDVLIEIDNRPVRAPVDIIRYVGNKTSVKIVVERENEPEPLSLTIALNTERGSLDASN